MQPATHTMSLLHVIAKKDDRSSNEASKCLIDKLTETYVNDRVKVFVYFMAIPVWVESASCSFDITR